MERQEVKEALRNWRDERDSAALYEALHPRADTGRASRDLANLGRRGGLRPVLAAAGLVAEGEDRGLARLGVSSLR